MRRELSNLRWQFRLLMSIRIRIGRKSNGLECCFDFVRAAFASLRTAFTDLSRRLRDDVSLENELVDFISPLMANNRNSSMLIKCFHLFLC